MKSKAIEFLEKHESATPSEFEKDAQYRIQNERWLRWSMSISLKIIDYMQLNGLTRADIAQRLGVSSQYVSRILAGNINHSLKSIAEMEDALGINLLPTPPSRTSNYVFDEEPLRISRVADDCTVK